MSRRTVSVLPAAFASLVILPQAARGQASDGDDQKRLAVLEFRSKTVEPDALMVLSDSARTGALAALSGKQYVVMTRESMNVLLQANRVTSPFRS